AEGVTEGYREGHISLRGREEQCERRALAGRGAHVNLAPVGAHELGAGGEAEAGPVGARGVERFEDARQLVGRDALPRVGDLEGDAASVGGAGADDDLARGR